MSKEPDTHPGNYPPPQWDAQQRHPYPPPPSVSNTYSAPPSQPPYDPAPPSQPTTDMVTLPPPPGHHDHLYRPPGYDLYTQHPSHLPYAPHGQDPRDGQQSPVGYHQPAPRQRTAIACRYCRRRKIRCHGFDQSPDGRCTNCSRFHQECIFTPVSSQTHAFVPAHTAYPHLRNPGRLPQAPDGRAIYPQQSSPLIYGAHGQPLGQAPPPAAEHNYPPPNQGYGSSPYPGVPYDDRGAAQPQAIEQVSRKRPRLDDSSSAHSPRSEGSSSHPAQHLTPTGAPRRESNHSYEYPDPTHMAPVSPATSTGSYQSSYPPQGAAQPYYPPPNPPRRTSPQSTYSYETRDSPQGSASSASAPAPPFPSFPAGLHPPQALPAIARDGGRSPPLVQPRGDALGVGVSAANGSRSGMSVLNMLGPSETTSGRSSADSNMLKALSRKM